MDRNLSVRIADGQIEIQPGFLRDIQFYVIADDGFKAGGAN
jgi:hypothetical protein